MKFFFFVGGCLNGSSAGKRRIAENIRTHITASFFVDDSKDRSNIWDHDLLALWSGGAALLVVVIVLIVIRVIYFLFFANLVLYMT